MNVVWLILIFTLPAICLANSDNKLNQTQKNLTFIDKLSTSNVSVDCYVFDGYCSKCLKQPDCVYCSTLDQCMDVSTFKSPNDSLKTIMLQNGCSVLTVTCNIQNWNFLFLFVIGGMNIYFIIVIIVRYRIVIAGLKLTSQSSSPPVSSTIRATEQAIDLPIDHLHRQIEPDQEYLSALPTYADAIRSAQNKSVMSQPHNDNSSVYWHELRLKYEKLFIFPN